MNQCESTLRFVSFAARRSSVRPFGSHVVRGEPQTGIRPAEEVDFVAGEIEASEKQVGDRFYRVEGKSKAQVSIGE
jgi:hypothetical protein